MSNQWTESYLAGFVAGYHDGFKLDNYGLHYSIQEYNEGFRAGMNAAIDDADSDEEIDRPELAAWDRATAVRPEAA